MKAIYKAPYVELVKINDQDIITASLNYNGEEIDAADKLGGLDLPTIGGWMND